MAFTIEELQTMRDALTTALARGELSVTFGDRMTMYRSVDALKAARDIIDGDISKLSGRPRQSLGVASKGLS